MKTWIYAAALSLTGICSLACAQEAQPQIAWYSTLKSGLAEAQRSNRPILLISAAPHCLGVSGIW